ncbi:BadF/BadG/BcrA/BcrD ATPase family protein [Archaeoglobus fulgidus]|jgi:predicted CoA-substrate-specific enzyme activase|uniref:(R)-hydroxyglutaryl-CoA dehydratase activator (HgdC) n=3 Tax=Archaeoglobus fulgidus TaxID=2234 RepID=O28320_ARCFU|nr:BadF/BadG/BcrA/BcrD ATPase family protein [Archaeoglobus fulgidus]AAB89296.1 (R)-hydroxyglutaryl-CoA dehydratase activator (hgdC) [Archaeoglobus fulgidus DSM 4304]AIG98950.1 CoA-substrate-specific enzyme activase, putative [Archaeoglobus fulgidus DSM 8774]KUJ93790.1 MAG: (R)-hydroxyglutaryl-CoA dehydratase activator (HgdC) [Archaeoglobus fulgidus]KUK06630.1 MAG: (R)-hydroxyglutaryl-CoA dehydratase activator (HgdC) [Archaeoglobus fulgidus]
MIAAGIDIGSLTAKCALMRDGKLIAYKVIKVSPNLEETAERVFQETLKAAGIGREEVERIVATGYGRNKVGFADKKVTEISCHARGAIYFIPTARTVVDIGGQDSKVIAIENGKVAEFVMNDKCAAGTGRFLEVMAAALNLKVEELGDVAERATKATKISSTCTVFAESEVISHLASGEKVEDIVAGIHEAIASRIAAMARRVKIEPDIVLTGGVAKNKAMKKALEKEFGMEVKTPPEPQIVGAVGAALLA